MNYKDKFTGMNNHYRFYQLETFFSKLASNGIHNVELWTGPMHFYVDYNTHDEVSKLIDLEKKYNIKIIGICPEQTNPKPNNIATKKNIDKVYIGTRSTLS